MTLKIC